MRISNALFKAGQPVAYFPKLAKPLGSVNAAILFAHFFYWKDKSKNPLGTYQTAEQIEEYTGLSRDEQRTARKKLKERGVLIETEKRIEHRIYYKLDLNAFDELMALSPIESDKENFEKDEDEYTETSKNVYENCPNREVENSQPRSRDCSHLRLENSQPLNEQMITNRLLQNIKEKNAKKENSFFDFSNAHNSQNRNSADKNFSDDFADQKTETQKSVLENPNEPKQTKSKTSRLETELKILAEIGVTGQIAEDHLAIRKAKRVPLTLTAAQQMAKDAADCGLTPREAIEIAIGYGWASFRADWFFERQNGFSGSLKNNTAQSKNRINQIPHHPEGLQNVFLAKDIF